MADNERLNHSGLDELFPWHVGLEGGGRYMERVYGEEYADYLEELDIRARSELRRQKASGVRIWKSDEEMIGELRDRIFEGDVMRHKAQESRRRGGYE